MLAESSASTRSESWSDVHQFDERRTAAQPSSTGNGTTVPAVTVGSSLIATDDDPQAGDSASRRWAVRVALAVIMLAAVLVRVPGVRWGLPARLHPDEWVITNGAVYMAARHSFEPPYYYRPDHLEMQLSTLLYRAYASIVYGQPVSVAYEHAASTFLALSRSVTVAFAVAAVLLAYLVGKRFGAVASVTAAFLVAFFGPFVANSSFATPDMPLTCILLGLVLACMRYIDDPSWRYLVLAAALVALSVTVKYPGAVGAVVLGLSIAVAAVRSHDWWRAARHLLAAPIAFVASIMAFSPVLVTNFAAVEAQLVGEAGSEHLGADGLGWSGNLAFYLGDLAPWCGCVILAAAAVGAVACVREHAWVAAPLVFGVVFWVVISAVPLHWDRWGLPIALTPLLLAAVGVDRCVAFLAGLRRDRHRYAGAATVTGAVLIVVAGVTLVLGSAETAARFAATDTRVAGLAAVEELGLTQANTVFDGYTPTRGGSVATVAAHLTVVDGHVRADSPDDRYVVVSSMMSDRYVRDRYPKEWEVYDTLSRLPVVARFDPVPVPKPSLLEVVSAWRLVDSMVQLADGGLAGPTITVYRLPTG